MIGRILCCVGLHSWDYSGNAYTFAPRRIRCERCRTLYGKGSES